MSQVDKMKHLMGYTPVNEHSLNTNGTIEYVVKGADNNTYGIIREGIKYYIKLCKNTEKPNIAESFDYIGGITERKRTEFNGYNQALRRLEFKLISLNEAHTNNQVDVNILNPEKKADLAIEGTEKMKVEINRQRQLMQSADAIIKEGNSIGFNNTGNTEAPKTANFTPSIGEPFEEPAKAELDKDFNEKASEPKSQGAPFDDEVKVSDADMQSDKNEKGSKDDSEDAKYVPDNSVANQKPSGGESVKMNENLCGEDGTEEFVGFEGDISNKEEEEGLGEFEDFVKPETFNTEGEGLMSDQEFEKILQGELDRNGIDEPQMETNPFENKKIDKSKLVESIVKRILKEAVEDGEETIEDGGEEVNANKKGFKPIRDVWFIKNGMDVFHPYYNKIMNNFEGIKDSDDKNEVDAMFKDYEKRADKLASVINGILSNRKLNIESDKLEVYTTAIQNNPEAAKEIVKNIQMGEELAAERWDKKVAMVNDKEFNQKNKNWKNHKNELGYEPEEDEMDKSEKQDNEYYHGEDEDEKATFGEGKKSKKVNEETTVLNDFGKHPGYQKKPFTLPTDSEQDNEGYKDWNDDSVKGDKPFGQKIGSSSPFDQKVKMITDAIMSQLKEAVKKKNNRRA